MTKDVGILVLGLLIAVMPFLGFTSNIETIIFVVSGLTVAVLAFLIRGEEVLPKNNIERKTDMFVENGGNHFGGIVKTSVNEEEQG